MTGITLMPSGGRRPQIEIVRAAIGVGAQITECRQGPDALLLAGLATDLRDGGDGKAREVYLGASLAETGDVSALSKLAAVQAFAPGLAAVTADVVRRGAFPLVLGGDHSTAIGTWSGIADAYHRGAADAAGVTAAARIGLIWIDAHLDSHTPETSETQAPHGMPLAALLGHGPAALTDLRGWRGKIDPRNAVVVGARSFESGEADLLTRLGVRVIGIAEVHERGLADCIDEAVGIANRDTVGYGVSFDVDAIDPDEAVAVGSPVAEGIAAHEAIAAMPRFAGDPRLVGFELVEYNPARDDAGQSTSAICRALVCAALCPGWQRLAATGRAETDRAATRLAAGLAGLTAAVG